MSDVLIKYLKTKKKKLQANIFLKHNTNMKLGVN